MGQPKKPESLTKAATSPLTRDQARVRQSSGERLRTARDHLAADGDGGDRCVRRKERPGQRDREPPDEADKEASSPPRRRFGARASRPSRRRSTPPPREALPGPQVPAAVGLRPARGCAALRGRPRPRSRAGSRGRGSRSRSGRTLWLIERLRSMKRILARRKADRWGSRNGFHAKPMGRHRYFR